MPAAGEPASRPSHRGYVKVWLDNHLPPALAVWMNANLSVECVCVRDLNLQRASDIEIFLAARASDVVVMTKDGDLLDLLDQHGPPPQVVWVTCGNTSNAHLKILIEQLWPSVMSMLQRGESLIELCDFRR